MAYYSGTAASLTALRTALLTHAQADGWTLTGNVLSKAGVYFNITETATHISCIGCESDAVANPAPEAVRIGRIWAAAGSPTREIVFPCNYEVFGFARELYLIVNYDVTRYQWLAFGKSTAHVPGAGGWCGATGGSTTSANKSAYGNDYILHIRPDAGGTSSYNTNCCALFWNSVGSLSSARNAWVNHGLDGHQWMWGSATNSAQIGIRHNTPLNSTQPSAWSSESVLLPIRAYKERPDYKSSLIADLEHARLVRLDNLSPGDVLTIGSDKWKVFPWYTKNAAQRDGPVDASGGGPLDHSGTLGWAIRYEGP